MCARNNKHIDIAEMIQRCGRLDKADEKSQTALLIQFIDEVRDNQTHQSWAKIFAQRVTARQEQTPSTYSPGLFKPETTHLATLGDMTSLQQTGYDPRTNHPLAIQ